MALARRPEESFDEFEARKRRVKLLRAADNMSMFNSVGGGSNPGAGPVPPPSCANSIGGADGTLWNLDQPLVNDCTLCKA